MRSRVIGALVAATVGLMLVGMSGCFLFLNDAPIAKIVVDVLSGNSPLVVTFNALDSSDPDGDIASYAWDFGDGESGTGATVQHVYVAAITTKTFTATLTITDDDGATSTATQTIEVRVEDDGSGGGTGMPTARFTVDKFIGRLPLVVTFDAGGSTAGDGSIAAHNWDFGDNEQATGLGAVHTYRPDETTTFIVTLFVWNTSNQVDTAQAEIVVIVPENDLGDDPPVADVTVSDPDMIFESDQRPEIPSIFEVKFDPRASYSSAGHVIEYYAWDFGDGDILVETTDLEITHLYELTSRSWTLQATLTVYDDQGESDSFIMNITLDDPE